MAVSSETYAKNEWIKETSETRAPDVGSGKTILRKPDRARSLNQSETMFLNSNSVHGYDDGADGPPTYDDE